ncbi:MAG TPA: hypothetical protein PKC24_01430 [Cyclobacteriaceae bacterium]|mgnify:CR=1 FL=1|nr:hypothetical protein [Cyclobacteriaceae bacterium]
MKTYFACFLFLVLSACGSGSKPNEKAFLESLDENAIAGPSISEEVIGDILQQIPSPLEISMLLKQSGKKYNADLLNNADNASRYNSNFKKALNLGIYGTDLGYTNIYEQNQDGIKYISSIKTLADGLNIGQFFDVATIGKLATSSKNLDSLLLVTTQNFNSINDYLQEQSRSNLSVLLLTGGWLEALHITCQISSLDPSNKDLQEIIGAQKIILDNIMLLLSFYSEVDKNMASLLDDLTELKNVFDKVNIIYTYKEATYEIVNGIMMIKDNSTSTVEITPEDINNIKQVTSTIRKKVIS